MLIVPRKAVPELPVVVLELLAAGWLNGMPGEGIKPDAVEFAIAPVTGVPLLSIMLEEAKVTEPAPLCDANETVAIDPLPESGLELMTAILIAFGANFGLAINIAPVVRAPLVTDGEARDAS